MTRLENLLGGDGWKAVGHGYDDVNEFLRSLKLERFKAIAEERKKIAERIKALQPEASNRAIGAALNVHHQTVANDLAGEDSPARDQRRKQIRGATGENSPRSRFSGARAAALIDRREANVNERRDMRARDEQRVFSLEPRPGRYRTLIVDPPWDYEWLSLAGRAKPGYATMSHEELLALPVPGWAQDESHLYLWTTNNFVTRAVDLMARWGFAHKTMLTWVKPRWGLGSYFRNQTEHVLFGVRGELRTRSDSISTVFEAETGEHSQKPEAFYDIVRAASFSPYGECFQRAEREGFANLYREKEAPV
jgi:N6-adenosine-specific RNA methylase IME4